MYPEGESKVALASLNFVVGIGCVSIILISLSIVPDCAGALSSQFLTYFVIQSTVHLGVLLVVTLTVSFLLATNDVDAVKDDSMDSFAGYTLLFGVIVVVCLQFMICLHRYLRIITPVLSLWIFSKLFVFSSILGSFLLGANKLVNSLVEKRSLNYSLKFFRWQFSTPEKQTFIQIVVASAVSLLILLYIASVVSVFARNFILLEDRRYFKKKALFKKLASLTAYISGDLFYAFLLVAASHRAQPKPAPPSEFSYFQSMLYICEGYAQCFLLLLWPALSAITYHKAMRSAIGVRTRLMMSGDHQPAARRRRASSKKISVISGPNPVYQYYDVQPGPRESIIFNEP